MVKMELVVIAVVDDAAVIVVAMVESVAVGMALIGGVVDNMVDGSAILERVGRLGPTWGKFGANLELTWG